MENKELKGYTPYYVYTENEKGDYELIRNKINLIIKNNL